MKFKVQWVVISALTCLPYYAEAQVRSAKITDDLSVETNFRGEIITSPTWVLERLDTIGVSVEDRDDEVTFIAERQRLALKGVGNVGIVLSCQNVMGYKDIPYRLNVAFDFDKSANNNRTRMRHVYGHLKIGTNSKLEHWTWNPITMRVVPNSRNVPRRVFNAAVRGDRIALKALGKWQVDIELPEINQDFRDFVKLCPAVQPKKK